MGARIWLRIWLSGLVLLGLLLWGSAEYQPAQAEVCIPLPPPPLTYPPQVFLPQVSGGGAPVAPPAACPVAEQEPNDLHDLAQPIAHCVIGAASNLLDLDWYRLRVCAGPVDLTVRLVGEGDVDLYVYGDPPGYPLAASESWGGVEAVFLPDLAVGDYYVVVQPGLTGGGAYTVTVEAVWTP